MSVESVIARARRIVEPSAASQDEKEKIAGLALDLINRETKRYPEIQEVALGGSLSKGTWLSEMADVDILVKFDRSTPRDRFTDAAHDVGFAALDEFGPYVRYSEHPFVEAVIRGTKINVVPCFDVQKGQWQSAADRTPFHTRFMQDRLSEPMRCEIRLLKQFLRCNGLYGSEISKQGFSGYVTEVLVLHFGSFEGVVRGFAGACPGWTVGKTPKKFDTPVVIIDPVDPQRNLAAAISNGNMGRFVLLCRAFLRGPSASFFEATKRRTDVEILKNCITIRFRYRARSPDMIWGQIKRASNAVAVQLDQGGFNVIRGGALTDEQGLGVLFFLLESLQLPGYRVREGPEFFCDSDVGRFVSKNAARSKLMWLAENRRVCSLERRTGGNAKNFLRRLLTGGLGKSGVPEGLQRDVADGFEISVGGIRLPKPIKASLLESLSTDAAIFCSR